MLFAFTVSLSTDVSHYYTNAKHHSSINRRLVDKRLERDCAGKERRRPGREAGPRWPSPRVHSEQDRSSAAINQIDSQRRDDQPHNIAPVIVYSAWRELVSNIS